YAGVGVQYFASMIVVDNQQKNTDFLEWARPTLELATMQGKLKKKNDSSFVLESQGQDFKFHLGPSAAVQARFFQAPENSSLTVLWKQDGDRLVAVNLMRDDVAIPSLLDDITVRVMTEATTLEPGKPVEHKYLLYNGPVKVRLLGQLKGPDSVDS